MRLHLYLLLLLLLHLIQPHHIRSQRVRTVYVVVRLLRRALIADLVSKIWSSKEPFMIVDTYIETEVKA
jgi:hypothetical protein